MNGREANRYEFFVNEFGARGDGTSDDTRAIQEAIDQAGEARGTVVFPEAAYACSRLRVPADVWLVGRARWSYAASADRSALILRDPDAPCLLDLTEAYGAVVQGLQLTGGLGLDNGCNACGMLIDNPAATREYGLTVDHCKVETFPSDGIRFEWVWCVSIRHTHVFRNGGCGLRYRGWDAFLLDNWLSDNGGAGFGAYDENAAVTFSGNRLEWNRQGGMDVHGGDGYLVNGNFFDDNGRFSLRLIPRDGGWHHTYNVTGNVFRRGASRNWHTEPDDAGVILDGARGLIFVANTLVSGRGLDQDGDCSEYAPAVALKLRNLDESVVKDNVLHLGATSCLIADQGGHGTQFVLRDNPGSLRRG
jgi:hypothetical protein